MLPHKPHATSQPSGELVCFTAVSHTHARMHAYTHTRIHAWLLVGVLVVR